MMKSAKRPFLVCFIPVLCLILNAPLWADSDESDCSLDKGYLKRDFLFKDRVNIYDDQGRRVGNMKQDVLLRTGPTSTTRPVRRKGLCRQMHYSKTERIFTIRRAKGKDI